MHELLDTLQGRSIVENAEERGYVEPAELEALALELDLEPLVGTVLDAQDRHA